MRVSLADGVVAAATLDIAQAGPGAGASARVRLLHSTRRHCIRRSFLRLLLLRFHLGLSRELFRVHLFEELYALFC